MSSSEGGSGRERDGRGRVVRQSFSDHFRWEREDQKMLLRPIWESSLFTRRIVLRSLAGRYHRI